MGFTIGPKSDSTSSQKNYNVSDSGQLNERGNIFQAAARGTVGKNSNFLESGAIDFSGLKLSGDASFTYAPGVSSDQLTSLVGNLSSETSNQIASIGEQNQGMLSKFAALVSQKNDSAEGNPRVLAWVAVAAIAAFAWIFWRK